MIMWLWKSYEKGERRIIAKPASCAVAATCTAAPQTAGTCIDGNETVCWGRTWASLNVVLSRLDVLSASCYNQKLNC